MLLGSAAVANSDQTWALEFLATQIVPKREKKLLSPCKVQNINEVKNVGSNFVCNNSLFIDRVSRRWNYSDTVVEGYR